MRVRRPPHSPNARLRTPPRRRSRRPARSSRKAGLRAVLNRNTNSSTNATTTRVDQSCTSDHAGPSPRTVSSPVPLAKKDREQAELGHESTPQNLDNRTHVQFQPQSGAHAACAQPPGSVSCKQDPCRHDQDSSVQDITSSVWSNEGVVQRPR